MPDTELFNSSLASLKESKKRINKASRILRKTLEEFNEENKIYEQKRAAFKEQTRLLKIL